MSKLFSWLRSAWPKRPSSFEGVVFDLPGFKGRLERSDGQPHNLERDQGLGLHTIEDIWVRSPAGEQLAYVQRISLRGDRCTIGHFAVERRLVGRGIARVLANKLFAELVRRYAVRQIVFEEDHREYEKAGYPAFFASLGATRLPPTRTSRRESWLWTWDSESADQPAA